jgi:phage gp16-like protein
MTGSRNLQRMIHVGCKQLGLDDDTRRDLQLVVTGKASMADMSEAEMLKVVDALKQRGFKAGFNGASKTRRPTAKRADVRLIHALWGALGRAGKLKKPGREGLNAFLRIRFEKKWGAVPIDVDALTDWSQITDVIKALKDWCRREGVLEE